MTTPPIRPRVRLLIADVLPSAEPRITTFGWLVLNDGDTAIVATAISAPDAGFRSAERALSTAVAPKTSERVELDIETDAPPVGSELHDRHLLLRFDDPDGSWRAIATLDLRFGPGGVVLPRTTALMVDPDPQGSGGEA